MWTAGIVWETAMMLGDIAFWILMILFAIGGIAALAIGFVCLIGYAYQHQYDLPKSKKRDGSDESSPR